MILRHFAVLAAWSLCVTLVVGILILPLMGDCAGDQACIGNDNRYFWMVVGPAFVIYWGVFIVLVRRWNR